MERAADDFFDGVRSLDDGGALDVVRAALGRGADHEALLLDVIAASQARVGMMWQANEWSVAREHAATHVSERAIGLVLEHGLARAESPASPGSVVVACVDGEWHGLPARLFGDVLRLRGWRVTFLGRASPSATWSARTP
nr:MULTISPECIES: B12-binding domain-containing protein [unclassified Nocardiopsis]